MITFPSHAAGAYLAIRLADYLDPSLGLGRSSLVITAVLAGMISDIDGLFYIGHLRDHHDTPLHTPVFWVAVFIVLSGVNYSANWNIQLYLTSGFIGIASHLFLDWYAGRVAGLRVFYPLTKKRYSLFPLHRNKEVFKFNMQGAKEYIKFYTSNRFLLISEVLVVVVAALYLVI